MQCVFSDVRRAYLTFTQKERLRRRKNCEDFLARDDCEEVLVVVAVRVIRQYIRTCGVRS